MYYKKNAIAKYIWPLHLTSKLSYPTVLPYHFDCFHFQYPEPCIRDYPRSRFLIILFYLIHFLSNRCLKCPKFLNLGMTRLHKTLNISTLEMRHLKNKEYYSLQNVMGFNRIFNMMDLFYDLKQFSNFQILKSYLKNNMTQKCIHHYISKHSLHILP